MIKNGANIYFRKKNVKIKKNSRKYVSHHKIFLIIYLLIFFKYEDKSIKPIDIFNIEQIFNITIKSNSILIFEKNPFHYECTPGFTKYFLDLGFNVDIIMTNEGKDIFNFFLDNKRLRIFLLDDSKYYIRTEYIKKLRIIFNKYFAILIQTMTPDIKYFYNESNLLNGKNSIFVYHYYPRMPLINFHNKIRSWTLLNFTNSALSVNPHYFGYIKRREKNKITRFLIVSTCGRNYEQLISASYKLKIEKFKFQIIVTGRCLTLSDLNVPNNIKGHFIFSNSISYLNLLKIVETIDFIIINLRSDNPGDKDYNNGKSTGSAQLAYGFLKPCLINSYFAETYGMNNDNSFIFNDSLYFAMLDAIKISNKGYKKKQYNMKKLSDKIYKISKKNVKTTLDYILKN